MLSFGIRYAYLRTRLLIQNPSFSRNVCNNNKGAPEWLKQVGATYEGIKYYKQKNSLCKEQIPSATQCMDDEVVIRVAYAGICREDLYTLDGTYSSSNKPIIMGHEISGYVSKVGANVKNVCVKDRVAVNPFSSCNVCEECLSQRPNKCPEVLAKAIGVGRDGGWAEYCTVPASQVYTLSVNISLGAGVLLTTLSNIIHAWKEIMSVTSPNICIAVAGAGIVGKMVTGMLHSQGYKNVIITEVNKNRRKAVKAYVSGDYEVLSPDDLKNNKIGVDIAFCTSRNPQAMEDMCKLLNPRGKMVILLSAPPKQFFELSGRDVYEKELKIMGAFLNPYTFQEAIEWADKLGDRYLNYKALDVNTFSLDDYQEAIKYHSLAKTSKSVFKLV